MHLTRRRFLARVAGAAVAATPALVAAGAALATLRPARAGWTPDLRARSVRRIVPPLATMVGEVFRVRRTIPARGVDQVDPFIMLDHFDFTLAPGELGGLAPHPHRGFETVTVLAEGAIEHGDSLGNRGRLEAGGVQWMTAASGIVHEENPDDSVREKGGRIHGIQLWVNLPQRSKMEPPRYQLAETSANPSVPPEPRDMSSGRSSRGRGPAGSPQGTRAFRIPEGGEGGATVRVIAGAIEELSALIDTHTPMLLADWTLAPGAEAVVAHPAGWTGFVHVIDGVVTVGGQPVGDGHCAVMADDGDAIVMRNDGPRPARALLGGGEPIAEPLARYGPFAMNTRAELEQAVDDYRSGRMGAVANPTYDRIRRR
ncbi:MAG: pirin family protein [Myxococcota bacterium]